MTDSHQLQKAYLLYSKPIDGARTGHCAFVILKEGQTLTAENLSQLKDEQVDFYFSMYPDVKPSQVVETLYKLQFLKGLPAFTVRSYEDDVVMRGESRHASDEGFKKRQSERGKSVVFDNQLAEQDDSAKEIIQKTLPKLAAKETNNYFFAGQYGSFIELPARMNLSVVKKSLELIEQRDDWGMFAPLPQLFSLQMILPFSLPNSYKKPLAHNCCSAVRESFKAGGVELQKSQTLIELPAIATYLLWAMYFTCVLPSNDQLSSEEYDKRQMVLMLPLVYFAYRLLVAAKNGYEYCKDLRLMGSGKEGLPVVAAVFMAAITANMLGAFKGPKTVSNTFDFPSNLFRDASKLPGVKVVKEIKLDSVPVNTGSALLQKQV